MMNEPVMKVPIDNVISKWYDLILVDVDDDIPIIIKEKVLVNVVKKP